LKEKYFEDAGVAGGWRAAGKLHSKVYWRIANLVSETDLELAPMASPVIFCRNVFIYFSESAARKTVRVFAERMPSPSYLFVGTAESLLRISSDFELQEICDAFVYVRN
jgi:chemotaxis protein methyltransferase CheR